MDRLDGRGGEIGGGVVLALDGGGGEGLLAIGAELAVLGVAQFLDDGDALGGGPPEAGAGETVPGAAMCVGDAIGDREVGGRGVVEGHAGESSGSGVGGWVRGYRGGRSSVVCGSVGGTRGDPEPQMIGEGFGERGVAGGTPVDDDAADFVLSLAVFEPVDHA